ncbi:unnamed protein product [Alternaria sp. RS040]
MIEGLQEQIDSQDLLVTDKDLLQGLLHILENEWFERLWTFQECLLAKDPLMIFRGPHVIFFTDFLSYIMAGWHPRDAYLNFSLRKAGVFNSSPRLWEACTTLQRYRESLESDGVIVASKMPLLLASLRSREVKEPVDRAWAVIGLFSPYLRAELESLVDYSDNGRANSWRTHTRFAKTIMATQRTLSLLTIPPTIEGRLHSVPSWCPALEGTSTCRLIISDLSTEGISVQMNGSLFEEAMEEADHTRSASAFDQLCPYASRNFISFEQDDTYLNTRGHVVDTISEVVEDPQTHRGFDYTMSPDVSMRFISNPIHAANVVVYTRSLLLAKRTVHRTHVDIDSIPTEYLMALLCDTRLSKRATVAYEDAWTVFTDLEHNDFEGLSVERQILARAFYERLFVLAGHSFFSTTGGRFGIATPGCKPGDKVCVFYGAPPLHILRWLEPRAETGAIHGEGPAEFCGVAFIPHLMKPHEQEAARLEPDEIFLIG